MAEYNIETIQTMNDLIRIRDEWNCLWEKSINKTPYQRWEWIFKWIESTKQQHLMYIVIVRLKNGKLIGIAPLTCAHNFVFKNIHTFRLIGQESSIYPDFIVNNNMVSDVIQIVINFIESKYKNIVLDFKISEPSIAKEAIILSLKEKWYNVEDEKFTNRLIINIGTNYDKYLYRISKKMRQSIGNQTRKLLRMYEVDFLVCSNLSNLEWAMKRLFFLNSLKWGGNPEKSHLAARECYKELAFRGASKVFLLKCDDKIVGGLSAYLIDQTVFINVVGFDYSIGTFDLGKIFYYYMFNWAIDNGYQYIDFSSGDQTYKYRYSPDVFPKSHITACNSVKAYSFFRRSQFLHEQKKKIKAKIWQTSLFKKLYNLLR